MKPHKFLLQSVFTLLFSCLISGLAHADVRLPRLVSDGLILQRDKPIKIWGWADEGEVVDVELGKQKLRTQTHDGRWQVSFNALPAGGPYCIQVAGHNKLKVCDVLIGDVWIAAGQSNMELKMGDVKSQYPALLTTTHYPQIREFNVPWVYEFKGPLSDFQQGQWKTAEPQNLANFSAAGFFFARQLYDKYHIPIGIIMLAVGGSPAEAWMSEEALAKYPHYLALTGPYKDDVVLKDAINKQNAATDKWFSTLARDDVGLAKGWAYGAVDENDWQKFTVPGNMHEQDIHFDYGAVWFRKQIYLSENQIKNSASLSLGAIVDADHTYINGTEVGNTSNLYISRNYSIPVGLLKAGTNTLVVNVISSSGNAGFIKDKKYALQLGTQGISLDGDWEYKISAATNEPPKTTMFPWLPYGLYNAKLAPCLELGMKGVIWYQGESNTDRSDEYRSLFPDLIRNWRQDFKQGDFPFIFVQLANYQAANTLPAESNWAQLREAQRQSLRVNNTGMAVAIDIGEWNDIHPLNKQAVGERLALQAMKLAYRDSNLPVSGPTPRHLERRGSKLILSFNLEGSRLEVPRDGVIHQLAIAGADKKFVWAEGKIVREKLYVWSTQITQPKYVRYAWADNPIGANLKNSRGLPATPFELAVE